MKEKEILKVEFGRNKVIVAFKKAGFKKKYSVNMFSKMLKLNDMFLYGIIESAKFEYITKTDLVKYTKSEFFVDVNNYTNLNTAPNELGYSFDYDRRLILVKPKTKKAIRLCKKHNLEYPIGSKCPKCKLENKDEMS